MSFDELAEPAGEQASACRSAQKKTIRVIQASSCIVLGVQDGYAFAELSSQTVERGAVPHSAPPSGVCARRCLPEVGPGHHLAVHASVADASRAWRQRPEALIRVGRVGRRSSHRSIPAFGMLA